MDETPKKRARKPLDIIARYDYRNAAGATIYQVVECRDGSKRMRSPDPANPTAWRWGRAKWGITAVPYLLPELLRLQRERPTLWVVPSERDAEEMAKLGAAATCAIWDGEKTDNGWQEEWSGWFAGFKTVVIVARGDPPPQSNAAHEVLGAFLGQRRAQEAFEILTSTMPSACRVVALVLPAIAGERPSGPARWFDLGGTLEGLKEAVRAAPPWKCPSATKHLSMDELRALVAERDGTAVAESARPAKLGPAAASSPSPLLPAATGGAPLFLRQQQAGNVGGSLPDEDPRSVAALRAAFIAILTQGQLDQRQKCELMEQATIEWLCQRGKLFYHEELRTHSSSLYFDAVEKRLSYIARDYFGSWLSLATGINAKSGSFQYIMARVAASALADRSKTSGIVPERYWARRGDRVYLSCGNGQMVRCSPQGAEVVDVGTDLVLFEEGRECQPWTLQAGEGLDPFDNIEVFKTMNALYPRGKMLLRLWTMSLPGHGDRTKPILLLTGKGRSGKTMLAISIMELFGVPAAATMVSKEYKTTDFWTLADAGGVMCLDNADSFTDWLPNALCTVATNGTFSKKMNYKDNELITQRARCWCLVTGTTPFFAAEHTVSDRLLTVELFGRADGDTKGTVLRDDLLSKRDAALTWICRAWCRALADESHPPSAVNARHPDWGITSYRLARAVDLEDEAVASMTESEASKAVFALRQDSLGMFLVEAFGKDGFEGTAAQISEALKAHCDGFDGDKVWTLPKIGKALKRLEDHLSRAFRMTKPNHSGSTYYKFSPIQTEGQPPTMLGVDGFCAQSAHAGDRAPVCPPSPPTSLTSNSLLGEESEKEEGWIL